MTLTKYNGREGSGEFRAMTLEEAKGLRSGQHVWFRSLGARTAVRVKVNGAPKRWKRSLDRIEIPVKYGLYEYARVNNSDIEAGVLLVEVGE